MSARKTFLLVENDAHDVLLMQMEFQKAHADVHLRVVEDGAEAQQYLTGEGDFWDRQKHPLPDVILLDLRMPRVDGFEFLTWLRSRPDGPARFIPVVVLSASRLPAHVMRAYTLGANGYFVKEIEWDKFQEQVRGLVVFWGKHAETTRIYSS